MNTISFLTWLVSSFLLLLSILIWVSSRTQQKSTEWLWDMSKSTALNESSTKAPPIKFRIVGHIPTKIYRENSAVLTLKTIQDEHLEDIHSASVFTKPLQVPESTKIGVVLNQAGFNLGGDIRQEQVLTSLYGNLRFDWVLAPEKIGTHQISLSAYWVDQQDRNVPIDTQIYNIKVIDFWGLPYKQGKFLSLVFALVAFLIPTIINICDLLKP